MMFGTNIWAEESWDLLDDQQKLLRPSATLLASTSCGLASLLCRGHKLHDAAAMKEDHLCVNIDHSRGTSSSSALQSNWCGDGLNIACHKVVLHDRSSSNFNIVSSRLYAMCFATIVEPFSERENRGEKTPAFTRGTLSLRVYCWGKIPLLPCVTARNGCKVRTFNTNDFFACSEPWLHAWKLSLEMHFRVRDTQRHVNFIIKLASGSIFS